MSIFQFTYTPEKLALGDKPKWISATDGDTPTIQLPVRMLGIDAPELHYGGAVESNPGRFDADFEVFLQGAGANLDAGLQDYLRKRLSQQASTRQITAGRAAFDRFESIRQTRLDRGVGKNGQALTPRHLFVMVAEEVFDRYGRFLCYANASYTKEERDTIPLAERPTFNLQMLQEGFAVSLLIYPNVPKPADLLLVQSAVRDARTAETGLWSDGERTLLPYEFRWIIDTIKGTRNGPDRHCGDIETGVLYPPQRYYQVSPENRLFFYERDLAGARSMGFTDAP